MSSDSESVPSSPLREEDSGKAVRVRVAPQRPSSPGSAAVVPKRRAAPARAVSSNAVRTLSPAGVRILGESKSPSRGRRAAPARRTAGNHMRSLSSGQDTASGRPLKQSNSAGSEEVLPNAPLDSDKLRSSSAEITQHSSASNERLPAADDLERTIFNRLQDMDTAAERQTRGRERRGAVDMEETRFRPWNTNKRIFNIMVQVLGASEKDKLMCEKLMRCSHRFKLLQGQEVINKQQEASLKQLEVAILEVLDNFLPASASTST